MNPHISSTHQISAALFPRITDNEALERVVY